MVVVVMVGILATLALPSINFQMKSNRTYRAAQEVATLYRQAKVRAMGRGSAVLFRFGTDGDGNGFVELREAMTRIDDPTVPTGSCRTPRTSCQGAWLTSEEDNREIARFSVGKGAYTNISLTMQRGEGDSVETLASGELCFTPLGRSFFRVDATTPRFSPLPGDSPSPTILVDRTDNISFPRRVLLPTNGAASIIAAERTP